MDIENLLDLHDYQALMALIASAPQQEHQIIRWYSPTRQVLVVGVCNGGVLVASFASRARDELEAAACQAIIINGIAGFSSHSAHQSAAASIALSENFDILPEGCGLRFN